MGKIIVFSGDDIVSSRKAFLEYLDSLKSTDSEITRVNGKELTDEFLESFTIPTSLFGNKKVLAIDNIFFLSKTKDGIIDKVAELSVDIAIWEGKEVGKTIQQDYAKDIVFKNFKFPSVLFSFLDSLKPDDPKTNSQNFASVIMQTDENMVFLMLIRQIRLLITVKDKSAEIALAPWQKAKLQKQASFFSSSQLTDLYKKLLQIDYEQKTSSSSFSLKSSLELLMTEI